eukprot:tig00000133_g7680.t1
MCLPDRPAHSRPYFCESLRRGRRHRRLPLRSRRRNPLRRCAGPVSVSAGAGRGCVQVHRTFDRVRQLAPAFEWLTRFPCTSHSASRRITLSLCSPNTTFDTLLYLFDGCGNVTRAGLGAPLAADNDGCGGSRASRLTAPVVTGRDYFIVVEGLNSTGRFQLGLTDHACPDAPSCRTATAVEPCDGVVVDSVVGKPNLLQASRAHRHPISSNNNRATLELPKPTPTPKPDDRPDDVLPGAQPTTALPPVVTPGPALPGATCEAFDVPSAFNSCAASSVFGNTTGAPSYNGNFSSGEGYHAFSFPTARAVTLTTCSPATLFDTILSVWPASACPRNASSAGASPAAVNDDDDACGLLSTVSFAAEANLTYIAMVEGFGSNAGSYELKFTDSTCPQPDRCLVAGSTRVDVTQCGAPVAGSLGSLRRLPAAAVPSAHSNFTAGDAFYHMSVPTARTITVDLCGEVEDAFDAVLYVFSGCPLSSSYARVAEDDDSCGGGTFRPRLSFEAQAGVNYTIVVSGNAASAGDFLLRLSDAVSCATPNPSPSASATPSPRPSPTPTPSPTAGPVCPTMETCKRTNSPERIFLLRPPKTGVERASVFGMHAPQLLQWNGNVHRAEPIAQLSDTRTNFVDPLSRALEAEGAPALPADFGVAANPLPARCSNLRTLAPCKAGSVAASTVGSVSRFFPDRFGAALTLVVPTSRELVVTLCGPGTGPPNFDAVLGAMVECNLATYQFDRTPCSEGGYGGTLRGIFLANRTYTILVTGWTPEAAGAFTLTVQDPSDACAEEASLAELLAALRALIAGGALSLGADFDLLAASASRSFTTTALAATTGSGANNVTSAFVPSHPALGNSAAAASPSSPVAAAFSLAAAAAFVCMAALYTDM